MGTEDPLREHREAAPTRPQASGLNEQGGCEVDWSWLEGRQVARVTNSLDELTVEFAAGQSFTVRALLWEGKPFLSFDPYRP